MPPKPKNKLLPSVRVSEELYNATVKLADESSEYLAEYIRKAVEERNARMQQFSFPAMPHQKEAAEALFNGEHPPKKPIVSELLSGGNCTRDVLDKSHNIKPSIQSLKEQVMESPKMVNSFMKGGK